MGPMIKEYSFSCDRCMRTYALFGPTPVLAMESPSLYSLYLPRHPHHLIVHFRATDMSKQSFRICFCFRRIFKIRATEPPEDVRYLFNRYSAHGTMTLDQLQKFLIEFQEETDATIEDAQAIFNSLKHLNIFHRKGLHLEAFFRYLLGDLNAPLPATVIYYYSYAGFQFLLPQLFSDPRTLIL